MTIIGRQSGIAFAPQGGLGTDTGNGGTSALVLPAPDGNDKTYMRYRWYPALNLDFAPQQIQTPAPPEVTGPPLPRGTYKGGAWATGNMAFLPRAAGTGSHLHWLLWSLTSAMTVKAVTGATNVWDYFYGGGDTGIYPGPVTANTDLSVTYTNKEISAISGGGVFTRNLYLSTKRLLPPDEAGRYRGETISDCRVAGLTLEANPGAPLQATASFVGRVPKFYGYTDVMNGSVLQNYWKPEYVNLADGTSEIPGLPGNEFYITCKGDLNLPTGAPIDLTAVQATLAISPNLTTVQQERVLFSYFPEGYTTTGWNIGVQLTIKKGIYELYDDIFFSGGDWTPTVWESGDPFQIIFQTGANIPSDSVPYAIELYAKKINWSMEPIRTSADNIVAVQITGMVEDPGDGAFAYYLRVRSGRSPNKNEFGGASTDYMKSWQPAVPS